MSPWYYGAEVVGVNSDARSTSDGAKVGPEHTTKHELTQWLEDHGAVVFWEQSNSWDYPVFDIKREHSGGTPDLLVLIGGYRFVIEYKTGDSVGQVYDALPQLVDYWREHVETDQSYVIGGEEFRIDGFLTATSNSPTGRLFPRYAEQRQDYLDMGENRQGCYDWGQLPPAEYRMTEQHIRTMWRLVKQISGEQATDSNTPHIGSLLSNVLITPSTDPNPAVLWNKGPRNQCWEVLS